MKTTTKSRVARIGPQVNELAGRPTARPEVYYKRPGGFFLRNADGGLARVNQQIVKRRLKRLGFGLDADQIIAELKASPVASLPQ